MIVEIPAGSRNKYEMDHALGRIRLADVSAHLLAEIGHFFDVYKRLEPGRSSEVRGWQDHSYAEVAVVEGRRRAIANRAPASA